MLFFSHVTADAATELQVSNSRLADVEAAFASQKSEVRFLVHLLRVEGVKLHTFLTVDFLTNVNDGFVSLKCPIKPEGTTPWP